MARNKGKRERKAKRQTERTRKRKPSICATLKVDGFRFPGVTKHESETRQLFKLSFERERERGKKNESEN